MDTYILIRRCSIGLVISIAGALIPSTTFAANSCGSAPLPTTPIGPSTITTWQFGTDVPATVTAWRIPCSATDSMPVLTLSPPASGSGSFVCSAGLTLLQAGGLQTTSFYFRTDPPTINSYCGDVIQTATVAIMPSSSTPASFDFDQGFSVDFDGSSAGHQSIAFGTYDPNAYGQIQTPGPDSVNVFVQGANVLFQNCTVVNAPAGGGKQYTASCALEAPIKVSEFQKYDY